MPMYKISDTNSIKAGDFRLKFKDVFDLKALYETLKDWLLEYGWAGVDGNFKIDSKNDEQFETLYWEKESGNGMKEQWWWWRLQRPGPTSYYKYHLDLNFHTLGISSTEVVKDGKKFKVNKGEVEIEVSSFIEYDVENKFAKHSILKSLFKLYNNRIRLTDLYAEQKIQLYREVYILQAFLKRWFQLHRFLPSEEVELFHPSKSFPAWKK